MSDETKTQAGGSVTPALSLTQPWATLVACGAKTVETRSWRTPHRGRLGIHAAKGFPKWARELCDELFFKEALRHYAGIEGWEGLPRGALLATVQLADCVPTTGVELIAITDMERAFGDYGPGRWGWLLDEPLQLDEPIPMRGALGLWPITEVPSVA